VMLVTGSSVQPRHADHQAIHTTFLALQIYRAYNTASPLDRVTGAREIQWAFEMWFITHTGVVAWILVNPDPGRRFRTASTGKGVMVSMSASETKLLCRDCGQPFALNPDEQGFYSARGFLPPSRCPDCRATRQREREALAHEASTARIAGSGFREPRPLFSAVCSDCGRPTMVPFEPRAGRSVFCRDCFQNHRDEYRS
jgi:CxxC-x17-CxxC domain-containing protein